MNKYDEIKDRLSCLNKATDNELLFVLLERDCAAPAAIRAWAQKRIELGKNELLDTQIQEALVCASALEKLI